MAIAPMIVTAQSIVIRTPAGQSGGGADDRVARVPRALPPLALDALLVALGRAELVQPRVILGAPVSGRLAEQRVLVFPADRLEV